MMTEDQVISALRAIFALFPYRTRVVLLVALSILGSAWLTALMWMLR